MFGARRSGRSHRPFFLLALALAWLMSTGTVPSAWQAAVRADAVDYSPAERGWNGLSTLQEIATEAGIELLVPNQLQLDELTASDGILIVHPTQPLPRSALSAFMRDGARVALADDFGSGDTLLNAFRIARRVPVEIPRERLLRGNRALMIATPEGNHPLAADVRALVANHPTSVFHDGLDPVFALDEGRHALVLSGAVGAGRLVTIGDASVFINNMLEFRGNRVFARNLLRYLARGSGGRVVLVAGATPIVTGETPGALPTLRNSLDRLARLALPPAAVRTATWALALSLVLAATTALPRPLGAGRSTALKHQETTAGFQGQVRGFANNRDGLLTLMRIYAEEFDQALCRALDVAPAADRREVVAALTRRRADTALLRACEELLDDLQRLRAGGVPAHLSGHLGQTRFQTMVETGSKILKQIESKS